MTPLAILRAAVPLLLRVVDRVLHRPEPEVKAPPEPDDYPHGRQDAGVRRDLDEVSAKLTESARERMFPSSPPPKENKP